MPRSPRLAALLAAFAAGCAHVETGPPARPETPPASGAALAAPDPATDQVAARLSSIRAEVDALLAAQGALLWEAWTRGAAVDLEATLAAHAPLFSRETVALVREARDRASGPEARALALLHGFLVGEHLSRAADGAAPDAEPSFDWEGARVPAARAPSLLAGESSAQRRAALARAWARAAQRQERSARARHEAMAAAARALGYSSLATLGAELRGDSPEGLATLAGSVLSATDATYRALLDALARSEMARTLAELRGCDLPRLFRAGDDRRLFPADRIASDARGVLAAIGLALTDPPGVQVDDAPRTGKDTRALTLPVTVPTNVRVSYAPAAGVAEMRGLLHELGAAAFYARVDATPGEFRRLGALTAETWSRLFADLVGDPAWLAERTGATEHELAPVVRATAARRLHRARLLAARLLDEVARLRDPPKAGASARTRLERAMLRPVSDDELQLFVWDRDPLLQSADELRALLLAAEADAFLSLHAGDPWWRSASAGAWLAAAFAEGSRLSPVELARAFGAERLDASALAASTLARVGPAGLPVAASP